MKDKMSYNIEDVKAHISTLSDVREKINYLKRMKSDYLQAPGLKITVPFEVPFDKQLDHEIKYFQEQLVVNHPQPPQPSIVLNRPSASKRDLIRVLNALYEIHFFSYPNKQIPSKKEFMEIMGAMLGESLSDYSTSLSHSYNEQPLEANLKIFNKMSEIVLKNHYTTKETN